jgi:ribosomal protein S18 acetylase RimI-like enzyme
MSLIRKITSDDTTTVIALSERSGLFNTDGIEQIKERLAGYSGGNDELWFGAFDNVLVGVVYCIPEPMTDGTWNILMLIVSPDSHGQGYGRTLMSHIEETLVARGARLVIVETSSADGLERARAFYPKCGYTEEARVRNFYTKGDDKIIFSKGLTA